MGQASSPLGKLQSSPPGRGYCAGNQGTAPRRHWNLRAVPSWPWTDGRLHLVTVLIGGLQGLLSVMDCFKCAAVPSCLEGNDLEQVQEFELPNCVCLVTLVASEELAWGGAPAPLGTHPRPMPPEPHSRLGSSAAAYPSTRDGGCLSTLPYP